MKTMNVNTNTDTNGNLELRLFALAMGILSLPIVSIMTAYSILGI